MYAARRQRLLEAIGSGVLVVPAARAAIRNNDVEHEWRQDSDFHWLSGFAEPDSVLVLGNVHPEHRFVLFVRARDPSRETWDGPRAGVEGARAEYGADAAYPIAELAEKLPDYLGDVNRVHYRLGRDRAFDDVVLEAIEKVRGRWRIGVSAPTEIVDPAATLHELRMRKEPAELATMARAAAITREAHLRAMEVARPGKHEYEVEAEILRVFRARGSERPAYGPICGSGPNATILHHRKNDRRMKEHELLLIDAGAELDYYASDVTRTFPISGRFTPEQRAVYDVVLDAQEQAIAAARPGATLDDVHQVAVRQIAAGLVDLGIVAGPVDSAIESGAVKAFYMHRTSHWLGMDVHDVGAYLAGGKPRPLEPGFVLTVEPGIYIAPGAEVPERWRGIGVRIEDDVVVTAGAPSVLTGDIPKAPQELEAILGDRPRVL